MIGAGRADPLGTFQKGRNEGKYSMTMQSAPADRLRSTATFLLSGGLAILCASILLYATELSRASAVWISPLGAALLVTGLWALRKGRRPPRALLVVMGIVALALIVLGLVTFFIALQAENELR
jgi:hypothetical protein